MTSSLASWTSRAQAWRRRQAVRLRTAGLVLAVPVLIWFAGWLAVGDDLLPVRWGAYGAHFLAGLAAVAAVLLAGGRRPWWALGPALLSVLILVPVLPRFAPSRWHRDAAPSDLRVMTFNVSARNTDYARIAGLIAREHPDIVFLQQPHDLAALVAALRASHGALAYQSYPAEINDTIILSRFALSAGQSTTGITSAVAATKPCPVHVLSLHAPHGQYDSGEQRDFFARAARAVSGERRPVIAGGDLNSTEYNSVQVPLRAVLTDAFADAGAGFGFTFPSDVRNFGRLGRLFRIDHIFFRGAVATAAWTADDSANSDHFAVVATFRLSGACK